MILRRDSQITTNATGTANGGNIIINSPIIAGFENSDIIANAVEGNGGNIDITTQGIFGLKFRDELTEKSYITASSQLGVSGRVEINNVNIDPGSGLTELPVEVKDSSQKVAQKCSSSSDNSFVITGKGGVPRNPSQYLNSNQTWSDTRDLSGFVTRNNNVVEDTLSLNKPAIIEATGFIRNSKGEIELIAMENKSFISNSKTDCRGYSK